MPGDSRKASGAGAGRPGECRERAGETRGLGGMKNALWERKSQEFCLFCDYNAESLEAQLVQ